MKKLYLIFLCTSLISAMGPKKQLVDKTSTKHINQWPTPSQPAAASSSTTATAAVTNNASACEQDLRDQINALKTGAYLTANTMSSRELVWQNTLNIVLKRLVALEEIDKKHCEAHANIFTAFNGQADIINNHAAAITNNEQRITELEHYSIAHEQELAWYRQEKNVNQHQAQQSTAFAATSATDESTYAGASSSCMPTTAAKTLLHNTSFSRFIPNSATATTDTKKSSY